MRRLGLALLVCACCATACGGHRFSGMSRSEASAQARAVVRSFALSYLAYEDPAVFRALRLVSMSRGSDSRGRDAWLALFRYPGGEDEACVWVRRATEGPWRYAFEETQSVANGRAPERVHDRCVAAAARRHLLSPDSTVGLEMATEAFAYPEPVSPFGPVPRGSYLADLEDGSAVSLSGVPSRFPAGTAPGTAALSAFVVDERTWRPVPGATVTAWPSTRLSGFSKRPPLRLPEMSITTTSDRHGAVALLNLPAARYGWDFLVRAPDHAPLYDVHVLTLGGAFEGDFLVARNARFVDETPGPPPCGTGC